MDKQIEKIRKNIEKVVINTGVGKLASNPQFKKKFFPAIIEELSLITGQKPSVRLAKKSIAGFNVREGDVIGLKTTLRGKRMVDFVFKINNVIMPRLRDFNGIDLKKIDQRGNLNIGFKDKSVFPEIDMDKSQVDFGFQITIIPYKDNREEVIEIYREIGVPLKNKINK